MKASLRPYSDNWICINKKNSGMTDYSRFKKDPTFYLQTLWQDPSMKNFRLGQHIKKADLFKLLKVR